MSKWQVAQCKCCRYLTFTLFESKTSLGAFDLKVIIQKMKYSFLILVATEAQHRSLSDVYKFVMGSVILSLR